MTPRKIIFGLCVALLLAVAVAAAEATEAAAAPGPDDAAVIEALPGSGEAMDIESCVAIAMQHNDALVAEREKKNELDGQMYQAVSIGLPSLDLSGDWQRGRDPTFALDESFGGGGGDDDIWSILFPDLPEGSEFSFMPAPQDVPAQSYWHAQANLNWTLNPIKIMGAVGAARNGIKRQDLLIESLEHETAELTISAYHSIVLAAEVLSFQEVAIADKREFLEITRLQYEMGLATRLDTLQAALSVANMEPQLRRARRNVGHAGANLNAIMGRAPETPLAIVAGQQVETDQIDTARALELTRRRPDIESVRTFVSILERNRAAQQADMRPYLTMSSAYGYVGRTADTLTDEGHDFWRASVALNIPIFDGMLTKGLVKETKAQIRRTGHELAGMERMAQVETLNMLNSLDAARHNLDAVRLNMVQGEEVLSEMTLNYRLGKREYLAVLEAQSTWAEARSNLIEARYEVLTLTASLKRAVGFSPLLPLAAIDGLVPGGIR